MTSPGQAYVLLGLRLGRHVEGLVDAYYGPPELKEEVDAEQLAEPADLVAQGDALLASVDDGWLHDQALGLRTYAGKLAGEEISYSDEVERCYGVRPRRPRDTAAYVAAHERLDELLPGVGELTERYEAWRRGITVPAELVVQLVGQDRGDDPARPDSRRARRRGDRRERPRCGDGRRVAWPARRRRAAARSRL